MEYCDRPYRLGESDKWRRPFTRTSHKKSVCRFSVRFQVDSAARDPLTLEDHHEPSTRRHTALLARLSRLFDWLRRKQFVPFSAATRKRDGLVVKLKCVARQHAAGHGHGNRDIEHSGNLECERCSWREFDYGNHIERWALHRAPRLAKPRNCKDPGHQRSR